MKLKETRVFTQPDCPNCDRVKEFLKNNEVKFETIDVTKNEEAKLFLEENNVFATPVTQFVAEENGKPKAVNVIGYDLASLHDAIDEMEEE